MISAARVAATFHLDPLLVLDADDIDAAIRVAAHNVCQADENRRRKRT